MKKVIVSILMIIIVLTLFAQKRNDCDRFKTIYSSKIQQNQTLQPKSQMSEYYINNRYGNEFYVKNDSELHVQEYLTWSLGNEEVSVFPRSEYKVNDPVYRVMNAFFLTKSRMWVITYEYDYPEDYTGEELNSGLIFFSEDGKTMLKEIKLNSYDSRDCVFDSYPQDFQNDIVYNSYTDANVFLCFPYILSVYGDIIYTFSDNIIMQSVSFSEDQKIMEYYDASNDTFNYFSINDPGLIYQGNYYDIKYFSASSDKTLCGLPDRSDGEIIIHKLDPVTHKEIKTYRSFVKYIDGVIYNRQLIFNELMNGYTPFYDLKIRFQEGTNHLIIISDDQYESVVEIDFKD